MSRYTRDEILREGWSSEESIKKAEEVAKALSYYAPFLVFDFYGAPEALRHLCCLNGGDEDWLIIARSEPDWLPNWIERTDSCYEPDVYVLNGIVIYVGSHA